jgi:hypothetical protein
MMQAGKPEPALLGRLREKSREELLFLVEQLLERKPDIHRNLTSGDPAQTHSARDV